MVHYWGSFFRALSLGAVEVSNMKDRKKLVGTSKILS